MNKRQLKKRNDKYNRLMIKLKPDIDQLSRDLATFQNPPIEDIPKLMCDAIESGMESVKIMTEVMLEVSNSYRNIEV